MIFCITAKADITQTAVKFTRYNFFAFPYPLITHIQHMCSWGKSQSMQFYQQCPFIAGTAHKLIQTQAQLLPVTPVLLLVESHREPRSKWKMSDKVDECELMEWQVDPVSDWDAAQDQPGPGTEHSPAPPYHSGQGRFPSQTCKAEQPRRHTRLVLQCAGDLSASLMSLRRAGAGVRSAAFPLD